MNAEPAVDGASGGGEVAMLEAAVRLAPDRLNLRLALADRLRGSGDLAAAIAHYQIAAGIAPDDRGIALGLAAAYETVGLWQEAACLYRSILEAEPANLTVRTHLEALRMRCAPVPTEESRAAAHQLFREAERLQAAGEPMQALHVLTRCTRVHPGVAPVHYQLGCLLQDLGQSEKALWHYELAARLQPGVFGAVHNAGRLAASLGLVERAQRYLSQAHRLRPQEGISMRLELLTEAIHDSTQAISAARARFERGLERVLEAPARIEDPLNKADLPTFYLAYHGVCNRGLHTKLASAFLSAVRELDWRAPHCLAARRRPGRVRVGFLSAFLRDHSIGKVARGLIAGLDREQFEVHVLNLPPLIVDETARWIRAHCDHWHAVVDQLSEARAQIAALELDVLFYQDIGLEPFSYLLAFARLARVQCVSYGHPDTTGIPNMDYYVSNDWYEPPEAAQHYSERLFQLRQLPTLACYQRPPVPDTLPTRAELGLPTATHLYVCAQTPFKLHPDFDGLLRRILERDGAGRIVLFSDRCEEWSVRLLRRFRRTLPQVADRIQFLPRQPYARFMQLLHVADVVLDTLHFNGMTTSLQALSVGTPIVTLPTGLQRGRVTQAMYRGMGIEDCVARDADGYASLAVEIARNEDRCQAIRGLIRERNHLLFEDRRAITEFERFFLTAHEAAIARTPGCGA
jgi:protein O-GlcNAc transferase